MSDETALLAAITANAGDDTLRLIYADWLDEHEAPLQAAFIRTQCQLAAGSAADPDYPDLLERHAELIAQFRPMANVTVPKLPEGFAFGFLGDSYDTFRRGFLNTVAGVWVKNHMSAPEAELDQFCTGLVELIATTTARELYLHDTNDDQLARVLAAPGAESLTGLIVTPDDPADDIGDDVLRILGNATATAGLERLQLWMRATAGAFADLAKVKFARLAHLDFPMLSGPARDLDPLLKASWFSELRSVRAASSAAPVERALAGALAKLPHLESLDVRFQTKEGHAALGAARGWPALARLTMLSGPPQTSAAQMAKAKFPRLTEFGVSNVSTAAALHFLGAKWFKQLRVLSLGYGTVTDKFVVALANSEVAPNLRILRLHGFSFGAGALAALADGTRFPNLTTLDLDSSSDRRKLEESDLAKFAAAISLPRLRHLDLSGVPLGDAGAKALAKNANLANLTRLLVGSCNIGDAGFNALVRSPHLQQLVELNADNNNLKKAGALLDPERLPKLAAVALVHNALTGAARENLHRARGWIV